MTPKFSNTLAWEQAQVLMQPIFIRLIDNIRKQLDESAWKGSYREEAVWADDVDAETRSQFEQLQQQHKAAAPNLKPAIEQQLADLPQPFITYQLCLQKGDREVVIDLWQLCYQICFRNYSPPFDLTHDSVEIDTTLLDEHGEVDWQQLETKTHRLLSQVFANLPTVV